MKCAYAGFVCSWSRFCDHANLLAAADTIPSSKAKEHVGRTGTVCGRVVQTRHLKSGSQMAFLDFDGYYPNRTFTVVIRAKNSVKFGIPQRDYLSKRVCITGRIQDCRSDPEIIVTELAQIKAQYN